ncbi:hypothetical protein EAb13_CDS0119 [Acinetobacter phage EAb13]|nr:hypothetical protein EAb13_CDS0001 [Acinetobacter phage EAb13]WGH24537.1 hypothetical protein EAb13_CDS0119 [Acinetobacter phage EAb13]
MICSTTLLIKIIKIFYFYFIFNDLATATQKGR